MKKTKVFCVPSIVAETGDAEGFGMVFAEANASGVPVVSFNTGGIPEAIEHGKTGLLAEEKDWMGLAKNILLLLKENDLWSKFSHYGQMRVKKLFDIRKQTSKLEEIYDSLRIREWY